MEIASARRITLLGVLLAAGLAGCRRKPAPPAPPVDPPLGHLSGRVVDSAGHPVPDAQILVFGLQGPVRAVRGTADVDGRFDLTAAPGSYRLLVEAAGFPLASRSPVSVPAHDVAISLEGQGRAIDGIVTRGGAPVEGATVRVAAEQAGPERQTRTGAGGRFAVTGLGEGPYALRAERDGWVSATVRGVAAFGPPVALALGEGAAASGRVTEDGVQPAAAVLVRAEDRLLPPGDDPLPVLARTDRNGAFRLGPLPPGRYRVTAAHEGLILRRTESIDVEPGATPAPIALDLLHGARLTGRVAGPNGAPLTGARVRCAGADVEELAVRPGALPLAAEAAALPAGAAGALLSAQSAVVDGRGRFALEGLPPGRYRIDVTRDGYQALAVEVKLGAGERRDLGALALAEGFPVRGRVLDQAGAPIEGAHVTVTGTGALPSAITDAAGQFSLALAPGRYRVTASAEGWGSASADAAAEAGGAKPSLELRLSRADASLDGMVRDAEGRPLARARLTARPAAASAPGDPSLAAATADAGGHFHMARLPSGELRIEVQHADYPRISAPATAGQFATIVVPTPGGVAGEVRGRTTGALVLRAKVEATGPDGATAAADTRGTGTFRLLHLAPGAWHIRASAPNMRPADMDVDVPASPTLNEPSVRDLRIDLDPA
jgi:hypothetical protein